MLNGMVAWLALHPSCIFPLVEAPENQCG
jgi:hypothetical protein